MRIHKIIRVSASVLVLAAVFAIESADCQITPRLNIHSDKEKSYKVVNTYPHDRTAFTQGLFFDGGYFYEGTGRYGRSELRKVLPETGENLKSVRLAADLFGEGVALRGDTIVQITWKSRQGFVYDKDSFALKRTFKLSTQGWGITFDGTRLIVSDGSNNLYFLDPDTFEGTGKVSVYDNAGPVSDLNELEYVRGEVYANVWGTDYIVMINAETGEVAGRVDLEGLSIRSGGDNVYKTLNGIAYDDENDRLFVTGKLWPELYEIKVLAKE